MTEVQIIKEKENNMKYYQTDELQKMIDWENLMQYPRYAGGHDQQMTGLFKDNTLIAHWNENDYQGMVATCVRLSNGKYAIYNDYYGSCSGCDSWEGAGDEEIRSMCISLSNSAYVFENLTDIIYYLQSEVKDGYSWSGSANNAANCLLAEILKNVQIRRDYTIDTII